MSLVPRTVCLALLLVIFAVARNGLCAESQSGSVVEIPLPDAQRVQETATLAPEAVNGADDAEAKLGAPALVAPELPGKKLSLKQALELALGNNPSLRALDYEVRAAEARSYQGSLKPNPELEAEISQFMGTAEMRFFRSAETGVGITQLVERGQKRAARMLVAEREGEVAEAEKERMRLDIMLDVSKAYSTVLTTQERLRLAAQKEQLAQQVYDTVALRVEAGKSARLELSRIKLDRANAQIEGEQAQQAFDAARNELAALWGDTEPDFGSVEGELGLPPDEPDKQNLQELLTANPDFTRWQAEECLRQAKLDLAVAEGAHDLTVSGGITRFEDTDSFGLRIGVSIPIGNRNRNQGGVCEAQAYLDQIKDLREAELARLNRELTAAYDKLQAAYQRATRLQADVLPAAQETFDLTDYGYRNGKFGMLEVLDAERTLIEAQSSYLEALADYQMASVEIERLIAQPFDTPSPPSSTPAQNQEDTSHAK